MNKGKLIAVVTICFLLSFLPARASRSSKLYIFPAKKVTVTKSLNKDLLVFGNDIVVKATVKGNVSVIGGSVIVEGGEIKGNCVSIGGGIRIKNGKVDGDTVVVGELFGKNKFYALLLSTVFWLFAIGFGYFFFAENLKENAFEFADDFFRLFFFGFYSLIVLFVLSLISFALIQTGIGIILFALMLFTVAAVYIFSVLTIFYFFGNLVLSRFKNVIPDILKFVVGLIVYQLLKLTSILGFVVIFVLISASIGATLYSRFGTFKPWFGLPRFWGE